MHNKRKHNCPVCGKHLPWMDGQELPFDTKGNLHFLAHECGSWDFHWAGEFETAWMTSKGITAMKLTERVKQEK